MPAQLRVVVTVRPKYMCRACAGKSHTQAPAPEFLVPRGLGTNRFVIHSVVSKFADHCPFYRQAEIWRRDGIDIDRTSRPVGVHSHDAGERRRADGVHAVAHH